MQVPDIEKEKDPDRSVNLSGSFPHLKLLIKGTYRYLGGNGLGPVSGPDYNGSLWRLEMAFTCLPKTASSSSSPNNVAPSRPKNHRTNA